MALVAAGAGPEGVGPGAAVGPGGGARTTAARSRPPGPRRGRRRRSCSSAARSAIPHGPGRSSSVGSPSSCWRASPGSSSRAARSSSRPASSAYAAASFVIPVSIALVATSYQGIARATAIGLAYGAYGAAGGVAPILLQLVPGSRAPAFIAAIVACGGAIWFARGPGPGPHPTDDSRSGRTWSGTAIWAFGIITLTVGITWIGGRLGQPDPLGPGHRRPCWSSSWRWSTTDGGSALRSRPGQDRAAPGRGRDLRRDRDRGCADGPDAASCRCTSTWSSATGRSWPSSPSARCSPPSCSPARRGVPARALLAALAGRPRRGRRRARGPAAVAGRDAVGRLPRVRRPVAAGGRGVRDRDDGPDRDHLRERAARVAGDRGRPERVIDLGRQSGSGSSS